MPFMMRRKALPLFLTLLTGCAQSVDRASRNTISRLQQSSVAADPADFAKGQLQLRYRWQIPPGSVFKVPMTTDLGIPSIPASINGAEVSAILDTGNAFPILLDAASAADLSLPTIQGAKAKGTGIGGNVDVLLARYDSIGLANRRILGKGVAGIFLHSYRTTFAGVTVKEIPLNLLGLPLLEQFSSITIDAPREEITFAYKRPCQPPRQASSFPFTIEEGRMWVNLQIDGQSVRAFLDTGCGSGLRLPEKTLKQLPESALISPFLKKRKAMGVGGVEHERVGILREAILGNLRLTPLEFDTSTGGSHTLLGWLPFSKNRITIDFERRKVWVERADAD
jgi:hypothetical protein